MRLRLVLCLPPLLALGLAVQGNAQELKNKLRPFTTDGCSNFPNGVPYFNDKLWLRCCVEHDVAYWQGGTKAMRTEADQTLYDCVLKSSGSKALANMIWGGVRTGGYPGLPTSTGWGKGWTIQRGYGEFSEDEKAQISALYPKLPDDLSSLELEKRPTIRPRYFLTDNHCLDLAVVQLQLMLKRGVEVEESSEVRKEGAEGSKLKLTMKVKGCSGPHQFEFLLLRKTACTDEMNELSARGRIRLLRWSGPKTCNVPVDSSTEETEADPAP